MNNEQWRGKGERKERNNKESKMEGRKGLK